MAKGLNARRAKFAEVYAGNATEAARLAGYKGSDPTLGQTGHELLRIPEVVAAIKARQDKEIRPAIATRQARQEFWAMVMMDVGEEMKNRLRASELLGKSEADFTEKLQVSVDASFAEALKAARERAQRG